MKHKWLTLSPGRLVVPHDLSVEAAYEPTPFLAFINMQGNILVEVKPIFDEKEYPFAFSFDLQSNSDIVELFLEKFVASVSEFLVENKDAVKPGPSLDILLPLKSRSDLDAKRKFISEFIGTLKKRTDEDRVNRFLVDVNRNFITTFPFYSRYVFEIIERSSLEKFLEEQVKKKELPNNL